MAEDLVFQAIVETAQSAQTLGEIKQSIKDINAALEKVPAGSKAFDDLTIALGKTKGQMLDLRERVKALDPEKTFGAVARLGSTIASGFAAAQGAIALFGGSSEDMLVILTRVQAAMALAQGLQGLAGFTKALRTAELAMKAFALANPFTAIAAAVVAVGVAIYAAGKYFDWWGTEAKKAQKANDDLAASNKFLEDSYDELETAIDNQIRLLKAQGKETYELELAQKKQLLANIEGQILNYNQMSEVTEKQQEQWIKLGKQYSQLISDIAVIEAEHTEKIAKDQEARFDKIEKIEEEKEISAKERAEKRMTEKEKEKEEEVKKQLDELQVDTEFWQKKNENYFEAQVKKNLGVADFGVERVKIEEVTEEEIDKIKSAYLEKELKTIAWTEQAKINYVKSGFDTIGQLALAFAGKSEASQRRAFAINKAASIAGALIDTYQAAQGAFKSQTTLPLPDAPIRAFIAAGIAMAAGLARVAMIAKTQFNPSGGGGEAPPAPPEPPELQSPQAQQIFATGTQVQQTAEGEFTGFAGGGRKPQLLKAYVVETELTDTQQTIKSIQERTTF